MEETISLVSLWVTFAIMICLNVYLHMIFKRINMRIGQINDGLLDIQDTIDDIRVRYRHKNEDVFLS